MFYKKLYSLLLTVCCCLGAEESVLGTEQLIGGLDRGIVDKCLNKGLQTVSKRLLAQSEKQNYRQTLPIKILASYLESFLVYVDQYNLGCFNIFQRTSIYSSDKLDIEGKEAFEFRLAGNLAAKLSSKYSSTKINDSIFTRIPVGYSILDTDSLKNITFDGPEGVNLLKQLFPSGVLSRNLRKSEAIFILNYA